MNRDKYKRMIKENVLDIGFAGWMADFGEYTPLEARSRMGARWYAWRSATAIGPDRNLLPGLLTGVACASR